MFGQDSGAVGDAGTVEIIALALMAWRRGG